MKVLAINGSPHSAGVTAFAIDLVTEELEGSGIEVERLDLGGKPIRGCNGCDQCGERKDGTCVFSDDGVNEGIARMRSADGILLGSPVHFASISGGMKSFLDRAFYVSAANGGLYRHKVGASLVALRRSGGMTAFDQLNRYLQYSEVFLASSDYWHIIHGESRDEAARDVEGCHIMRTLGRNLAWLLRRRCDPEAKIPLPPGEPRPRTPRA